ncbi:MAG: division/cell wall cluster transcriptional repressor MraZ [Fidelibacterota bacterium]
MKEIYNISFTGEFSYSLDAKGRLSIPAKYRKSLNPENHGILVIVKGFDGELIAYPLIDWLVVEAELNSLNSIKRRNRNFVRNIIRTAAHVQLDSHGRIAIPEALLNYAKIEKDVRIVGMIKRFELWNPSVLTQYELETSEDDDKNFEDLANDISF